jgi:hypothetical protein
MTAWEYAVERTRTVLKSEGRRAAWYYAEKWKHSPRAFDAVKLLAEANNEQSAFVER